jgi:Carbohydrate-binding family 9
MQHTLPPAPVDWASQTDMQSLRWDAVPSLPAFMLADGSSLARWQTRVKACASATTLHVHFECDDADIWGHYTQRDAPIYDEEVVELFIGPGGADPTDYFEFEISPNGVLFDARIRNVLGHNDGRMGVDAVWDCAGLRWHAARDDAHQLWQATLAIPWRSLLGDGVAEVPKTWRANFYRIERPHNGTPEFSCWSPTLTPIADFHRPKRFGTLILP